MVVRLKGNVAMFPNGKNYDQSNNSIQVDMHHRVHGGGNSEHFLILQKSNQCIPLIQFPTNMVRAFTPDHPGNKAVHKYNVELQHLCDNFFNGEGVRTVVDPPSSRPSFQLTFAPPAVGGGGGGARDFVDRPRRKEEA